MKKLTLKSTGLIAVCISVLSIISFQLVANKTAYADFNDFSVNLFAADYFLDNSTPHGHMKVIESIDVHFNDYNHGILRALPSSYKKHNLHLNVASVSKSDGHAWPFSTYEQNGNTVLKIGDPNYTVTGDQSYIIEYSLDNVITNFKDHDELYWDINGTDWQQKFNKVVARVHLPIDILTVTNSTNFAPKCFTGSYGSNNANCAITNESGTTTYTSTNPLFPGETLSILLALQPGTFKAYSLAEKLLEHCYDIIFGFIGIFITFMAFRNWMTHGQNFKGRGVIIPEYGPPEGLGVLEAGILQDYKLDTKDITATIIDLAVKGYIKIIEETKSSFGYKRKKYKLSVVNPDFDSAGINQAKLANALFGTASVGSEVALGTFKPEFLDSIKIVEQQVDEFLIGKGLLEKKPKNMYTRAIIWVVLAVLVMSASIMATATIAITIGVLSIIICVILAILMPRRSIDGEYTNEHLKGLKLFIKTTDKDRIKLMSSPNAKYANTSTEPEKTVELFEKLLPFAIIFGIEKGWAKEFESLMTEPPNWYSGNWQNFSSLALVNSISSGVSSSVASSFSAPSSSSSSGFSGGGGFAGGGGGGGGGGGW